MTIIHSFGLLTLALLLASCADLPAPPPTPSPQIANGPSASQLLKLLDPPSSDIGAFLNGATPKPFPVRQDVIKHSGYAATCNETRHVEPILTRPLVAPVRRELHLETVLDGSTRVYRVSYLHDSELRFRGEGGQSPLYQIVHRIAPDEKITVDIDITPALRNLRESVILYERPFNPSLSALGDPFDVEYNVAASRLTSIQRTVAERQVSATSDSFTTDNWNSTVKGLGIVDHLSGPALLTETTDTGTIFAAGRRHEFFFYLRRLHNLDSGLLIRSYQIKSVKIAGVAEPIVVEAIDCTIRPTA